MMRTTGIQEMFLAAFLTGFTLTAMAELAGNQLHIIFPTKKYKFSVRHNAFREGYIRMQNRA